MKEDHVAPTILKNPQASKKQKTTAQTAIDIQVDISTVLTDVTNVTSQETAGFRMLLDMVPHRPLSLLTVGVQSIRSN